MYTYQKSQKQEKNLSLRNKNMLNMQFKQDESESNAEYSNETRLKLREGLFQREKQISYSYIPDSVIEQGDNSGLSMENINAMYHVGNIAQLQSINISKNVSSLMGADKINQNQELIQKKENSTGLPDNLKEGVENFSGMSMDNVKVHYNSDKPSQLGALAYTQGNEIHVAPGQEKHLPHEAWHVVQQAQGRVKPTKQLKNKVNVNDDDGLEHEADVLGRNALESKKHDENIINQNSNHTDKNVFKQTNDFDSNVAQLEKEDYTIQAGSKQIVYDTISGTIETENAKQAYIYEIIAKNEQLQDIIRRYNMCSESIRKHVGLSIVINAPYNPGAGRINQSNMEENTNVIKVMNMLRPVANANICQNVVITYATWFAANPIAPTRAEIPFGTMRGIAAKNNKVMEMDSVFRESHNKNVWRKTCDSDVEFTDPNEGILADILNSTGKSGVMGECKSKMVSLGYDLRTNSSGIREDIVKKVYTSEMTVRSLLKMHGARPYPPEPTTFYQISDQERYERIWSVMNNPEGENLPQQKEGRRLQRSLQANYGVDFYMSYLPNIVEATSAGARNNVLLEKLGEIMEVIKCNGRVAEKKEELKVVIKSMDQSHFSQQVIEDSWNQPGVEPVKREFIAGKIEEELNNLILDIFSTLTLYTRAFASK